jgi:hypothetical protein
MNAWHMRSWLLQNPKPAKVRLTDAEGEIKELDCQKRPMVRVAESIAAINPELVECLSVTGELLRALRPNVEADAVTSAPPIPAQLSSDPHSLLLSHFAALIHRAYEHSTELAFNKLIELVERLDARSDAIERRLERAESAYRREQSERIDDLWERAEEVAQSGGSKDDILKTLLSSMMAGAQHRQAQGAPQGEPKPNGGKPT